MPFLNSVHLMGHLSDDPKGRDVAKTYVCNFRIGINNGNKDKPAWSNIDCVVWGNKAKSLVEVAKKGDVVELAGKIATRSYDNKEGRKIWITEVVVGALTLVAKKAKDEFEVEE